MVVGHKTSFHGVGNLAPDATTRYSNIGYDTGDVHPQIECYPCEVGRF